MNGFTLKEAAEALGLSEPHLRYLRRRGELPARRVGRGLEFDRAGVEEYRRRMEEAPLNRTRRPTTPWREPELVRYFDRWGVPHLARVISRSDGCANLSYHRVDESGKLCEKRVARARPITGDRLRSGWQPVESRPE